jgi:hypothetical protein
MCVESTKQILATRQRKDGSEIRVKVRGNQWLASNFDLFTTLLKVVFSPHKERKRTIKISRAPTPPQSPRAIGSSPLALASHLFGRGRCWFCCGRFGCGFLAGFISLSD